MTITIITATYNSAATVRDTFDSLLNQTYSDIEYIVVDGASTDGTVDIIKSYEPRFNGRMRWINEADKGIYDAMNKGIAMATGDVIGILNSDDFYTSNDVLQTVVNTLQQDTTIDAVYGDVHYVAPNDLTHCVRYYSSKPFRRMWMRMGFMPAHPSFYCKRRLYQQYGAFDLTFKVAADFENLLRLIYLSKIRMQYIEKDFVTMRTGGASTSGFSSHWQITKDHLKALKKNHIYSNVFLLGLRYLYKIAERIKQH